MVNKKITIRLPSDLEKKLKYVETISGKSKEFIFQEALLKFFEGLENTPKVPELRKKKQEVGLMIKLPKDWVDHLIYLEQTTNKSKNYYVKEALLRYLESIHELQIVLNVLKSKTKPAITRWKRKK